MPIVQSSMRKYVENIKLRDNRASCSVPLGGFVSETERRMEENYPGLTSDEWWRHSPVSLRQA
jgi:hypothetical protein